MLSFVVMVFGLLGGAGLWAIAWMIFFPRRSRSRSAEVTQIDSLAWGNEPTPATPARRELGTPPDWLFEGAENSSAVPEPRARASSSANTQFFNREEIDALSEATEILDPSGAPEEMTRAMPPPPPLVGLPVTSKSAKPVPPPPPVSAKKSRKTWVLGSNKPTGNEFPPRESKTQPNREVVVLSTRGGKPVE